MNEFRLFSLSAIKLLIKNLPLKHFENIIGGILNDVSDPQIP